MDRNYDVIIVGSGIGGICCAAMLSHAGYRILVLEKNNFLGGRASSYKKDGCIVDTEIHLVSFTEKSPLGQILKIIDKRNAIKFWHIDHNNRPILFLEGKKFIYPDPSYATEEEIRIAYEGMGISDKDCDEMRAVDKIIYGINEEESHELDDVPYLEWLKKYTENRMVHIMHESRAQLTGGIGPEEASAGEMIRMTHTWHLEAEGGAYPYGGGIGTIAETFAEIIRENDGAVEQNKSVDSILIENGKAVGVRLKTGEKFMSSAVVSNAGIKTTVSKLVPAGSFSENYYKYVKNLSYGARNHERWSNHLSLHVLVDEPIIKEPILFSIPVRGYGDSIKALDAINFDSPGEEEKKALMGQIHMYATVTSNMDPSVVPPGKQLINLSVGSFPKLSIDENIQNWKNILDFLYPGIKDKILWVDATRGSLWKELSGHPVSNIIGIAQTIGQVGKNRPSAECPVKGLFHAGADVGKRKIGIELAADGALLAADAVKKYLK